MDAQSPDRGGADHSAEGMRLIPGGTFTMGSDLHYQEERPAHPVAVDPFWMDQTMVTNAEFAVFVAATQYETVAERPLDPAARHEAAARSPCCAPQNPRGRAKEGSFDPRQPAIRIPRKVVKGGSFLCAPSYGRRYRPAARNAQMVGTGMSQIGFRCLRRLTPTH